MTHTRGTAAHLGSACQQADGRGFNIQIETVPLDGRISLRVPTEKPFSR